MLSHGRRGHGAAARRSYKSFSSMKNQDVSMRYRIPPGYLNCHVWTKVRDDTFFIESCGRVISKHKLIR